jgi:uncharacterized phage infection (PIP) family protein YhgE
MKNCRKIAVNITVDDSLSRKTHREVLKMATKVSELAAALASVHSLLGEGINEVLAKIQELEDALVNASIPDEAQTALDAVKESAQALADIVPNVPPVES